MKKLLRPVSTVTLVVKEGNTAGENTCPHIEKWLTEQGIACSVLRHPFDGFEKEQIPSGTDLLLVLGGDGTMVSVARKTLGMNIPVAGINFGRVGFLAELRVDTWQKALVQVLENGLLVEPRMTLSYRVLRNGENILQGEVINDVVVTRGKVARLVKLGLGVNRIPFTSLRSDGLILSTPTGASGYAGSAGGPFLLPTLFSYVVAAICPYLCNFPPLVLSEETVFSVSVEESAPDLYLTLDGQSAFPLTERDVLEVSGGPNRVLIADFGISGYFERLRQAGFVQDGPAQC